MRVRIAVGLAFWLNAYPALRAQSPSHGASADSLLGRLVGRWTMTGTVRGKAAVYTLDAVRVLRGRFVELHMQDTANPPTYEARVFIGVDTTGARYVAHWLDTFGGSYSIPHATGAARGDTIDLLFPYPKSPFHDTFVYDRRRKAWTIELDAGSSAGGWTPFARYTVRPR